MAFYFNGEPEAENIGNINHGVAEALPSMTSPVK